MTTPNTQPTRLPESPNEMPFNLHNDANWLRNLIVGLDGFYCVDIHFERDTSASDVMGESVGEWNVTIETNRKQISAKCENVLNALWYANELAQAASSEAYEQRLQARKDALNKLSTEDKRILGLI